MKWYSVKKYRPAHAITECFVRTSEKGIVVAYNCEMAGGRIEWVQSDHDTELKDVTHFCMPDPIPLEDE